jgi:NIMA (never in mitosis gene a)-related kinase 1/4/5
MPPPTFSSSGLAGYTLGKVLGKGGFGQAMLAKKKDDGSTVVIKQVKLQGMSRKEQADAQKEAAFLASVRHPNIVRYISHFTEGGFFYLVMEFADGGDLSARLASLKKERRYLTEDEALNFFTQITMATHHLHRLKIIHRDLKSQNGEQFTVGRILNVNTGGTAVR